ncbi:uncharacterized protein MELLADRAFT_110976 [Melampsora larici-populina 98AG31]|uniref:Uncharacterized protein n=1 Tax=Melampsora larici-populina (strain 98AG31 / pathotype 3-4-7) TaxID=747676 RepID=F4S1M3_MELLP|nr:uncharacterized protein MELLADRAFT_110976 [Melampsora larici-populina 98AG31]EGG01402.1 hypothetical protein MELLADRAFT_110976 [Melampsora larici-populina 98AG31]
MPNPPSTTVAHREAFIRIKTALEAEGLSIPVFIVLANDEHATWDITLTSKNATHLERIRSIYHFITHTHEMSVIKFLLTLLHPQHDQLRQARTEWLYDGDTHCGYVFSLLKAIKSVIYSFGHGKRKWENFIYGEMCDLEIYAPPPSPDCVPGQRPDSPNCPPSDL